MKYPAFMLCALLILSGCRDNSDPSGIQEKETAEATTKAVGIKEITKRIGSLELEIVDFEGLKKYLNKKDGKTYVINFWATWCAPCIKELPHFERLNAETADNNVEVILVSLDFPSKYETLLKPYILDHNLKSKVIALDDADSNSWIPQVNENWSGAIPATLIYNNSKNKFHEGSFNFEELQNAVKPFIK